MSGAGALLCLRSRQQKVIPADKLVDMGQRLSCRSSLVQLRRVHAVERRSLTLVKHSVSSEKLEHRFYQHQPHVRAIFEGLPEAIHPAFGTHLSTGEGGQPSSAETNLRMDITVRTGWLRGAFVLAYNL